MLVWVRVARVAGVVKSGKPLWLVKDETYVDWAYKVLVPHKYVCHGEPKNDSQDPSPYETLDCLLG